MTQSLAVATWIVGMLAAVSAIGIATRWLYRTGGKVTRVMDALLGEPPGPGAPNGRPGVLERLTGIDDNIRDLNDRLSFIESQMRPNGGSSLRDTVDRIAVATEPTPDDGKH